MHLNDCNHEGSQDTNRMMVMIGLPAVETLHGTEVFRGRSLAQLWIRV